MAKYTKTLELLSRLLDEKNITVQCNSEKTAVAEFKRTQKIISYIRFQFKNCNTFLKECSSWEEFRPGPKSSDYLEDFGPFDEVKPILVKIVDSELMTGNIQTSNITIDDYNEYWNKTEGGNVKIGYKLFFFKKRGISRIDNKPYYENTASLSIKWIPSNVTNTPKRKSFDAIKEMLPELQEKVREKIGTLYALPGECHQQSFDSLTQLSHNNVVEYCNAYINGEIVPDPCSPKQAVWVAKMLGIPESIAQRFNKLQASEILNTLFNSKNEYTAEDIKNVKEFYLNKAREFGYQANNNINENKKIKRTARINENRLKKIVAESLRTILREMANETNKLPIRLVGGDLQGEYDLGTFEREHSDLIKGRITPEQYPHLRPDLHGYPKIAGYLGPMYDGDAVRYETQEVYDILST